MIEIPKEQNTKTLNELIEIIKERIVFIRKEDFGGIIINQQWQTHYVEHKIFTTIDSILKVETKILLSNLTLSQQKRLAAVLSILEEKFNSSEIPGKKIFGEETPSLSGPLSVCLNVIGICNLQCIHCYTDANQLKKNKLSYELAEIISKQLGKVGIPRISLTGGEPLMHDRIFDIIKIFTKYNSIVSINTNGMLLTKERVKILRDIGLHHLNVSIEGPPLIHNEIRRGKKSNINTFDSAIRAIELAKTENLRPRILHTVMKSNIGFIDQTIDIAKDLGVDITIKRLIPSGRTTTHSDEILTSSEAQELITYLSNHSFKGSPGLKYDRCWLHGENKVYGGNCHSLTRTGITITSSGDVYSCPFIQEPQFLLGNVKSESIKNIYSRAYSSPFQTLTKADFSEPCSSCEDFSTCGGGCRVQSFYANDDFYGCDTHCSKL